jgi:hypothetical protein
MPPRSDASHSSEQAWPTLRASLLAPRDDIFGDAHREDAPTDQAPRTVDPSATAGRRSTDDRRPTPPGVTVIVSYDDDLEGGANTIAAILRTGRSNDDATDRPTRQLAVVADEAAEPDHVSSD